MGSFGKTEKPLTVKLNSWLNAVPDLGLHGDVEAPDVRVAVAVVDEGGGVEPLDVGVEEVEAGEDVDEEEHRVDRADEADEDRKRQRRVQPVEEDVHVVEP